MSELEFDEVDWLQHDWEKVAESPYIMKHMITQNSYSVVVTDLINLYAEKLSGSEIEDRFHVTTFLLIFILFYRNRK